MVQDEKYYKVDIDTNCKVYLISVCVYIYLIIFFILYHNHVLDVRCWNYEVCTETDESVPGLQTWIYIGSVLSSSRL